MSILHDYIFVMYIRDSASNRNEYQEYFLEGKGGRCVGLTTLTRSCVDCLEMWEPQPPGTLKACPGITLHQRLHYDVKVKVGRKKC